MQTKKGNKQIGVVLRFAIANALEKLHGNAKNHLKSMAKSRQMRRNELQRNVKAVGQSTLDATPDVSQRYVFSKQKGASFLLFVSIRFFRGKKNSERFSFGILFFSNTVRCS